MNIPDRFETSYGRSIPVLAGYYEAHQVKARVFHAEPKGEGDSSPVDNSLQARVMRNMSISGVKRQAARAHRVIFDKVNGSYLKDAFEYGVVVDFLSSIGFDGPWNTLLDIGGAEGYIARLFKAEGRTKTAVCVDVIENKATTADMWLNHYRYKRTKLLDGKKGLLRKLPNYFGYYPSSDGAYLNIRFREAPALDEHIVGDALSVSGRFDMVTAFLCLEYFDLDDIFPKVHELLDEQGIFAVLVNYWWWPVNSTAIVGHFPYAAQRLAEDDFQRYLSEFHPDLAAEYTRRYRYFHKGKQRPTIRSFLEAAQNHGFESCGYLRLTPQHGGEPKTPLPPSALKRRADFSFSGVLDDIAQFRDDVAEIDLRTAYALCIFQKR